MASIALKSFDKYWTFVSSCLVMWRTREDIKICECWKVVGFTEGSFISYIWDIAVSYMLWYPNNFRKKFGSPCEKLNGFRTKEPTWNEDFMLNIKLLPTKNLQVTLLLVKQWFSFSHSFALCIFTFSLLMVASPTIIQLLTFLFFFRVVIAW